MIGCTKLLCGTSTVAAALRQGRETANLPPSLLQFSADNRPVVVWNVTNRCNLHCRHCYIRAENHAYAHELTTEEATALIKDLAQMGVPVLLFSGGEPLLRDDIFSLAALALKQGIRPVLSTNGTLITPAVATRLREAGFQYVGVSLDGREKTHDTFRGRDGAFQAALDGLSCAEKAGIRTGVRFTVNKHNFADLEPLLELTAQRGIPRFCLYHLVYAGRGRDMADLDLSHAQSRAVMNLIIDKTLEFHARGIEMEIMTTDNHADGVFLLRYLMQHAPEKVATVKQLLLMHGGCSAGAKMANVDPVGNVHACQFWGNKTLGNVKETSFREIWNNPENPVLHCLRHKAAHLSGRCGRCHYRTYCGGCRIRAEVVGQGTWGEDPACYLTEQEITD